MKFTILSVTFVHLLCVDGAVYSLEFKQTEPRRIKEINNIPLTATRIKKDQQTGDDPTPQCSGSGKYPATSCEQYYECERIFWWWKAFLKTCPEGEGFHTELEKCSREGLINCLGQFTTTTVTPEPTTLASTTTKFESPPSTSATKRKEAVSIDLPHDSVLECSGHAKHEAILCNMYFECELIFELFWLPNLKTCPDGEAFDSKISECNREALANCPMQSSASKVEPQKESVATTKPPALLSTTTLKAKVPDCSGPGRYPAGICNQYYECEETTFMLLFSWWQAKLKTCPDGEAFDKRIGKCKDGVLNCQTQSETSTTVSLQNTTSIGKSETNTNLFDFFVSTNDSQNMSTATDFIATKTEITIQSGEELHSTTTTPSSFVDVNAFVNLLPIVTETTQENTLNVSSDNSEAITPTTSVISSEQFLGINLTNLEASSTIISAYSINDMSMSQNITNTLETELLSVTNESTSSFLEENAETITTSKYNFSTVVPTVFDINAISEATNFSNTEPIWTTTNEPVSSELITELFSTVETSYSNQDSISESTFSNSSKTKETTKVTATLPSSSKPTIGALHFLLIPIKNNATSTSAPVTINITQTDFSTSQNNSEVTVTTTPLSFFSSSELITRSTIVNNTSATPTSACSKSERRPGPVCNQYFECVPVSGSYKLETCPNGEAYDTDLEECESAELLNCSEAISTTFSEILDYDDVIGASPKTTLAITATFPFIFYFIV